MLERVNYLWLAFAEGVASAASPQNLNFFRRPWNFGDETSRNMNFGDEATSPEVPITKKSVRSEGCGLELGHAERQDATSPRPAVSRL